MLFRFTLFFSVFASCAYPQALKSDLESLQQALVEHRQNLQAAQQQAMLDSVTASLEATADHETDTATQKSLRAMSKAIKMQSMVKTGTVDDSKMIESLKRVISDIAIGGTGTFAGSGVAESEITFEKDTSIWSDQYIHNGFDRTKTILGWIGTGLAGTAMVLNANPNKSITAKQGTAIGGAGALLVGSILQKWFGAKDLDAAKKGANNLSMSAAQLMVSRAAFEQLDIRLKMVDDTFAQSDALIDEINNLRKDLDAAAADAANPLNLNPDKLLGFVSRTETERGKYEKIANFIESYTQQIVELYAAYEKEFPMLKDRLDAGLTKVTKFQQRYKSEIVEGLLSDFPTYAALLADMRAQLLQQKAANQAGH
jgi:hypothetical protein